jgi:hypothetical protein
MVINDHNYRSFPSLNSLYYRLLVGFNLTVEVFAGTTEDATITANALEQRKILHSKELVGARMDGWGPSARYSNVEMLNHVANMASVTMTSVNATMVGREMSAMMKLSTR